MKFGRLTLLLWTAIAVGGALRFAYVVYLPGQRGDLLHSDMAAYDESGRAFAKREAIRGTTGFNGYHPLSASTYYHVGYTWFVGACYWLTGDQFARLAIRLSQAALSTVSIYLVYLIGERLFGRRAATIAACLQAAHLPTVFYCGLLLTETPFIFLELAALWLWLLARENGRMSFGLCAGVLGGLACTVRTAFLPALAAWFIEALWQSTRHNRRAITRPMFGLAIGAAAVISPVAKRNLDIHGRFYLLSTNGPATFYTGHVTHNFANTGIDADLSDAEAATILRRRNFEFLRTQWPKYLAEIPEFYSLVWASSDFWPAQTNMWMVMPLDHQRNRGRVRMVADEPGGPEFATATHFPDLMRYGDQALFVLIGLPAALLAPFTFRTVDRRWIAIYLTLLPFLIVPWIAPPFARYRIPAVPLVFLLAGQSLAALMEARRLRG